MKTSPHQRNFEDEPEDTEIVLGGGSILAIFFGVLLLCGLVFGFGYSIGRHRAPPVAAPITEATRPKTPVSRPAPPPADSERAATEQDTPAAADAPAPERPSKSQPSIRQEPAQIAPPSPPRLAAVLAKPHAGTNTPVAEPVAQVSGQRTPLMVQIAAVNRQEDAEMLTAALRRRGFTPMIRHGLSDDYFHVQVGPFADRAQAESMKDRLMADGYNAILK